MGITGFNRWRRLKAQQEAEAKKKEEAKAEKAKDAQNEAAHGSQPVEGAQKAPSPDKGVLQKEELVEISPDLIAAAKEALKASEVTKDGRPTVEALEKRLGRDVSAAERDAAWKILKKEHETDQTEDESAQ